MKRKIASILLAALLLGSLVPAKAAAEEPMVLYKQSTFSSDKGGDCVFYYDEQGNCVREEWKDAFDYDLSMEAADERLVEYTYDNSGVLMEKRVHDEGKLTWIMEYNVHGHEETVWTVDAKGKKTLFSEYSNTYDEQDRLTSRSWEEEDYDQQRLRCYETYEYFTPEELKEVMPGDEVTFGSFVQSGKKAAPIEWIVLDSWGGKVLLLSKYALDCRSYHKKEAAVTWHTSDLYDWLNNDFYQQAFDEDEKLFMEETDDSPNDIPERVFLLSLEEVNRYFSKDEDRICQATDYAVSRNAYVNASTGGSWWWLRTGGGNDREALSVYSDGRVDTQGDRVNGERGVVRPAIWVRQDGLQSEFTAEDLVKTYTRQEYTVADNQLELDLKEQYDRYGNLDFVYKKGYGRVVTERYINTYDSSGRLVYMEMNKTAEETYLDKVVENHWRPYAKITYTYDAEGRMIRKEAFYDSGALDHIVDSWEYDDQGNMVRWDGNGFGEYTYVPLRKALWKETP